jgi:dCTP deaminase
MAFWSSKTLKRRIPSEQIIVPYADTSVVSCAYELRLGDEAFVTSSKNGKKQHIRPRDEIVIHPGQFGLLITKEVINIPKDTLGLISIKASIKFRGLINVSGFHVDPGFNGRLKFSVYNAGGQDINLSRDQLVFMIWFAALDEEVDVAYKGEHQNQMEITSKDVMDIKGEMASPAVLSERLTNLERSTKIWGSVVFTLLAGIFLAVIPKYFEDNKTDSNKGFIQINIPRATITTSQEAEATNDITKQLKQK